MTRLRAAQRDPVATVLLGSIDSEHARFYFALSEDTALTLTVDPSVSQVYSSSEGPVKALIRECCRWLPGPLRFETIPS